MLNETAQPNADDAHGLILGKAPLVRHLYEGRDISSIWDGLMARVSADMNDAAAFLDLSTVLQTLGHADKAAQAQTAALDIRRTFEIRNGRGTGPKVLVFATAGDFMANTPIEFLLEDSDATILLHYTDAAATSLAEVPPHDVAFVAVGESPANQPILSALERLLTGWSGPIMNNAPMRIAALTRDGVSEAFADEPSILAPRTISVSRQVLAMLAQKEVALSSVMAGATYPIIVRPAGTHAGQGMEKIAGESELDDYLKARCEADYYLSPFVDYSGPDGKFRKQRIAFIDGRAFASHLAVSDHWMVHYLSAGMAKHAERRDEEATWMRDFDCDFSVRHASAFQALHRRLGLDYFAIDCAELADGRLLLFEADVAMIVHSMDSEATFPYKKQAMRKLFAAFQDALQRRCEPLVSAA
ncbi:tetratricopeptide repeat-containing protein [Hyphomicrobium sp.]|uniref:ATP-grasp domain-containing protein n=1 Tax=Hyphomicrobium sp. TaxID=82 RepID=UPI002D786E93|nr:tetratricopeptide repeat-containing protein [Hyphomicrobium sp.]HET6388080.1 tetratricopeptide repeat-containing protein [Hyphomicrobium sp.]